jgi:hypothetical protein
VYLPPESSIVTLSYLHCVTTGDEFLFSFLMKKWQTSRQPSKTWLALSVSNRRDNSNKSSHDQSIVKTRQDDTLRTHRKRRAGNCSLPLPPFMNQGHVIARSRWRQPKAKVDNQNLTPFQQKLYANPYGMQTLTKSRMIIWLMIIDSSCVGYTSA